MTNNGDHIVCAIVLWEAQARCKQFEMENAALRQEIERLKQPEDKPEPLKAVPPPEESEDGIS